MKLYDPKNLQYWHECKNVMYVLHNGTILNDFES